MTNSREKWTTVFVALCLVAPSGCGAGFGGVSADRSFEDNVPVFHQAYIEDQARRLLAMRSGRGNVTIRRPVAGRDYSLRRARAPSGRRFCEDRWRATERAVEVGVELATDFHVVEGNQLQFGPQFSSRVASTQDRRRELLYSLCSDLALDPTDPDRGAAYAIALAVHYMRVLVEDA